VIGEARTHDELVELLRARKDQLGLSNGWMDSAMGLTDGHCDKVIGVSGERGLSRLTIDGALAVLALKIQVVEDKAQAARMRPIWEKRDQRQVRPPSRISKALVAKVRPHILREAASRASKARWGRVSAELRSTLMRRVSLARWRPHANAFELEPPP
jgi:hypothetical protein